jgi:hypothetical protein
MRVIHSKIARNVNVKVDYKGQLSIDIGTQNSRRRFEFIDEVKSQRVANVESQEVYIINLFSWKQQN